MNECLRAARRRTPSRLRAGEMGRDELASLVAQWITEHDPKRRYSPFDGNALGKLERGVIKCPRADVRRALCELLGATEAELGFAPSDDAERVSAAVSGRLHTDARALTAVADALAHLRQLEDFTSASTVLPNVLAQRATVRELAKNAKGNVRKTAVGLLSELEQYLGWLSIPIGRLNDSRVHLDRSATLALEADDPIRLAHALSFNAYRNLRERDFATAAALNEAAGRDTRTYIGLRAYGEFQRAEILAKSGEQADSLAALSKAEHLSANVPEPDEETPASCYYYTPEFFVGQGAFTLIALGDVEGARTKAREALSVLPEHWADSEWAERWRRLAG
ncbi:XRE family transcriptional regulator [Amycolatopsis minnesotensis]|uniref:XRE family transcriptional regulator n=1 Tax=Amycolatopsis minnesotensis TaxID=337894 RepID=UPI0031E0E576